MNPPTTLLQPSNVIRKPTSHRLRLCHAAFGFLLLPTSGLTQTIDYNAVLRDAMQHYVGDITTPVQARPIVPADEKEESTFTLSKGDVLKSVITSDATGHTTLTITFTPERRAEYNNFTENNLNKLVKFVCNGKTISEPRILGVIKGSSMEIPVNTPAEAATICESVLASLSPNELEIKQQELEAQTADVERASHTPLPNKLISDLQNALDSHDKAAFETCFNFDGANEELRKGFTQLEDEIFAMPSYYVFVQNRMDQGKAHMTKNGKNYTLNGDWTFDVGIYNSKAKSKGYVLAAGMADRKCRVLLTVEDK